ncbi:MAG: NADH-quinone oxidoreductase subunit K [candidate division Zixibacteria bacterium]|nr:NADH-quinone oxidoreductase subunit K [candidate division Zixibacteria bacterium]
MTPGQFQMLSVALFCIGVYGLSLRRDSRRMIISLGIMIGAVALSLIGSNLTMNTENATGVYFAVMLILYGLVVMFLLAQSGRALKRVESSDSNSVNSTAPESEASDFIAPETRPTVSSSGADWRKKISRETLIALQIPLMLAIVVGDSLSRISPLGFYAFLLGIVALSFLAIRANKAGGNENAPSDTANTREPQNPGRLDEAKVL